MFKKEFNEFIQLLLDESKAFYGDRLISFVLFGSQARGTQRPDSDIDVFIVLSNAPKGRLSRTNEFMNIENKLETKLCELRKKGIFTYINSIIKTKEEVIQGTPLLIDMTEDAIILFDRDNFINNVISKVRERLKSLGARRIWRGDRWYWLLKPDIKEGEVVEL